MQADIYDSMAEGVQGARVIVCFMSPAYQESANCNLELKFAQQSGKPIVPVKLTDFEATGWPVNAHAINLNVIFLTGTDGFPPYMASRPAREQASPSVHCKAALF